MIIFKGLVQKNKSFFISFQNDAGESIDVPIDRMTATRIPQYLAKISKPVVVKDIELEEESDINL